MGGRGGGKEFSKLTTQFEQNYSESYLNKTLNETESCINQS